MVQTLKSHISISRRRFLVQASVLTSAPFILPGWSKPTPPGSRITLGFIGLGIQGRGLMKGFLERDGVQVVAVCDVDTNRREDGRKRVDTYYGQQAGRDAFRGCLVFEDFRELVSRPDIDAVVVATPDHWHALVSIAAAKAGKDIYCEKPLSKSVHESRAMVKAVRKNHRVLQVGSMQRSMREFRVACELVRNGCLGKIDHVNVTVGGPAVPCDLPGEAAEPGLNWDRWLGPAEERPYNSVLSPRGVNNFYPNWRHYREYGGGGVTDFGAHHFDIAQWGLGMDDSGPREITPPADWQTAQHGVRMRYANGIELVHAPGHNDVTFFGSDGVVQVDRGRIAVTIGGRTIEKGGMPLRDQLDRIEKTFLQRAKVRLYRSRDHQGDWLTAIRTRKKPICDVEIGARTATVCHLVDLAYYHGELMKWNPAREKFTDGAGDPCWLDVPHRTPWKIT
jgi:predicted dehydrogenase